MADNDVMDNSYYGLPPQEQLDEQKIWLAEVDKMFKSYKAYKPNRQLINYFLNKNFDYEIYDYYAYDLTLDAMSYFQAGITQRRKEFNVDFFRCLHKLYMMCPEANKITYQKEFVKEWQYYPIDYCPYFETIIAGFFEKLEVLLDKASADPVALERRDYEEIRWKLLISPVNVLLRLFKHVIKNPSTMLDFTINLCKSVETLFNDRPLKIYHNEYEVNKVEPLLCVALRRFICCCRCEATEESEWETIGKLAMEFCKGGTPLMSSWTLLEVVLNEIYSPTRTPIKSLEILTGLAADLLAPENENPFDYTFASSMRTQPAEKWLLAPTIIDMLLNMMTNFHMKKSMFVVDNCKRILKGLSLKMREQNVHFDKETKEHILEVLRKMPWWVEYTMCTWFDALNVEKRRVPEAIFKAIYPDSEGSEGAVKNEEREEDGYDTADESDDEGVEEEEEPNGEKFYVIRAQEPIIDLSFEYIRCIMQLGLFDAESVLELLHAKPSVVFKNLNEIHAIMEAILQESYLKKLGMIQLADARLLVVQILEVFSESSLTEQENVVRSLIDVLPLPTSPEDFPKWTHNIEKSIEIQALAKPIPAPREPWPPADAHYVHIPISRIREEQKRQREQLMKLALERTEQIASQHREKWAQEEIESWQCPPPPPHPSMSQRGGGSIPRPSRESTPPSGSSSPTISDTSTPYSTPSSSPSENQSAVVSPVKKETIIDESVEFDDTLVEQMENEMKGLKVEQKQQQEEEKPQERFASLRRAGPNQVLGGISKRGGHRH